MSVRVIDNDFDPKVFNTAARHPLQSWEWGEARKKMGIDVVRLGEFSKDTLRSVFQITFHPVPHTSFVVGYLPRSAMPSEQTITLLKEESQMRNAIFVKLEPHVTKEAFEKKGELPEGIRPAVHSLFPRWTQQLDLAPSEETLLSGMKPKTRYNIRLAEKKGVEIKEMTNEKGFEIFIKLYFETTTRQKYHGHTMSYHKNIFDLLSPSISHIFVAFYKNVPLSAFHIFNFNNILYYPYGGSSLEYKNLMASNLLMWEVIKFGKKQGCKIFDMWGSLPPNYDSSTPWGGFTRFKEGFGTRFVEFVGSFDLVNNSFMYTGFNIAETFRKKFLL